MVEIVELTEEQKKIVAEKGSLPCRCRVCEEIAAKKLAVEVAKQAQVNHEAEMALLKIARPFSCCDQSKDPN